MGIGPAGDLVQVRADAGPDQLIHLIGKGETPLRRAVRAERLRRAGQIGQGFGNRNQLAALTLHWLYSPMFLRQDRDTTTGVYFPRRHLWNRKHRQGDEDAGAGGPPALRCMVMCVPQGTAPILWPNAPLRLWKDMGL